MKTFRPFHTIAVMALAWFVAGVASAHVTISPRESQAGATEKYTVRVPTEGKVATTSAEVEIPEGVIFETMQVPNGWTYELKRKDDRVVAITFQMNVKPGEFAEFSFVARNPRDKAQLHWTLRQKFADGKMTDFTKRANGEPMPTALTKLNPIKPR
ncbi:MAG: DUF1775 domain-containing protein [Candidatus Solibacter usitatus]|nr:DUF1775 domain-containing protein [Candidatus Solibacter usitatus]